MTPHEILYAATIHGQRAHAWTLSEVLALGRSFAQQHGHLPDTESLGPPSCMPSWTALKRYFVSLAAYHVALNLPGVPKAPGRGIHQTARPTVVHIRSCLVCGQAMQTPDPRRIRQHATCREEAAETSGDWLGYGPVRCNGTYDDWEPLPLHGPRLDREA